ncbi:hypothetical protein BDZ97DRAFT_374532 [Flammula alnicola]|nr:hypothetical protein BDZ97DRAFT_374532 [Flammula alnicola]
MSMDSRFWLKAALLWISSCSVAQSTFVTPFLQPSFLFDWNDPTQPVPIPTTEQCETIHITWSRGIETGYVVSTWEAPGYLMCYRPNPTAPYFLQVYTSAFIQPFIIPAGDGLSFDWPVPFAPDTLYQICMFDKFGNTGGCQNTYTVIPASTSSTCANVTFYPQLGVTAIVDNGPMSQYGFIDQCTDISLMPTGGTPPYTLTVAPALHPPYNITSFDKPINWTVSLNWAMPFFISLADSNGSLWSNGPLHAGGGGTVACLAGNVTSSRHVKVPVAVGVSFAGLIVGILAGTGGVLLFLKRHSKKQSGGFVALSDPTPSSFWHRIMEQSSTQNRVEPFRMPVTSEEGSTGQNQVYVLHHDSNASPVTILHQNGTEIVELPPRYLVSSPSESEAPSEGFSRRADRASGNRSPTKGSPVERSERHYDPRGPLTLHQPRQPKSIPRKLSHSGSL